MKKSTGKESESLGAQYVRFAFCKEQTAQAKENAFWIIMVYFSVAPPTFVGWADCM